MPAKNKQKLSFGGGMNVQKMVKAHQEMQEKEQTVRQHSARPEYPSHTLPSPPGGSGAMNSAAMNFITF